MTTLTGVLTEELAAGLWHSVGNKETCCDGGVGPAA